MGKGGRKEEKRKAATFFFTLMFCFFKPGDIKWLKNAYFMKKFRIAEWKETFLGTKLLTLGPRSNSAISVISG